MPAARFVTFLSRRPVHSRRMDAVAVILGVLMFMVLLALIEGIDRV